jgi:hypothetical protein
VPPECLFPEKKDFPDLPNLRKNLITVPSCDKHNLNKSEDDQYLLSIISSYYENNSIGERLFHTKVIRTIRYRPLLALRFFRGLAPALLHYVPTGAFFIDLPRFNKSMEYIARGIYFYHFNKKAPKKSGVTSYSLIDVKSKKRNQVNAALLEWRRFSGRGLSRAPKYGDNPKIFYYQVVEDTESERVVIRLVFYEGVVVDVLLSDQEP